MESISLQVWFEFRIFPSRPVAIPVLNSSLSYYFTHIWRGVCWVHIFLCGISTPYEIQTALSWIRTQVSESTSNDDNCYVISTSVNPVQNLNENAYHKELIPLRRYYSDYFSIRFQLNRSFNLGIATGLGERKLNSIQL